MTISGETAQALWCTAIGESEIRPTPVTANAGEELVDVIICDVSPLDRQVAEGRFPPGPPMPVIPGTTGVVRDAAGKLSLPLPRLAGAHPGPSLCVVAVRGHARDRWFVCRRHRDVRRGARRRPGL